MSPEVAANGRTLLWAESPVHVPHRIMRQSIGGIADEGLSLDDELTHSLPRGHASIVAMPKQLPAWAECRKQVIPSLLDAIVRPLHEPERIIDDRWPPRFRHDKHRPMETSPGRNPHRVCPLHSTAQILSIDLLFSCLAKGGHVPLLYPKLSTANQCGTTVVRPHVH